MALKALKALSTLLLTALFGDHDVCGLGLCYLPCLPCLPCLPQHNPRHKLWADDDNTVRVAADIV